MSERPIEITILFLASNPKDMVRNDLEKEAREITRRIRMGKFRGNLALKTAWDVQGKDLSDELVEYEPYIVHFSGHGTAHSIALRSETGQHEFYSTEDLCDLIRTIPDNICLVVLNSCFTGLNVQGLTEVAGCVVSMTKEISDESAISFAGEFYHKLASGRSVREAFELGKLQLERKYRDVPNLSSRDIVDPAKLWLAGPKAKDWQAAGIQEETAADTAAADRAEPRPASAAGEAAAPKIEPVMRSAPPPPPAPTINDPLPGISESVSPPVAEAYQPVTMPPINQERWAEFAVPQRTVLEQFSSAMAHTVPMVILVGILSAIALPNYVKVKEKAKEAEVKANLHNVQLSVERFAVDTEGAYPAYLIGGEPKYANQVNPASSSAFSDVRECDPLEGVSDPLLRRGYIDAYPRNPFTRNGITVHQLQENLPTSQSQDDPLRNAYPDGRDLGTRFGPYCTSMGSVLCEPRYHTWEYVDKQTNAVANRITWCDIEYQFWDMWQGNKPLPYLPGQFFYKGNGPIVPTDNTDAAMSPIQPTETDSYMFGGYGGIRTKGKDVLGTEAQITYRSRIANTNRWLAQLVATDNIETLKDVVPLQGTPDNPDLHDDDGAPLTQGGPRGPGKPPGNGATSKTRLVWPWTRSQVGAKDRQGSPYSPANIDDSNDQLTYGNPNGIRDGIVLVLTAGEDYIGDR